MKSFIFPGKFLMGQNLLSGFADHAKDLGKRFLVISSKSVIQTAKDSIDTSIADTDMSAEFVLFGGESSRKEIARISAYGKEKSCEAVVGVGGGKVLDTAKAVALEMSAPIMAVPSIASTDAPCSALSVIYSEHGAFEEYLWLPKNPEVVLVDTGIISRAPVRFLVSGMGDALATYFEARAAKLTNSDNLAGFSVGKQTKSAFALAELCYDILLEDGVKAKIATECGVLTPALENVIEANILLSGLGFESGGVAAAHSVHNGLTALEQTHGYYHGEKVSFGVITQLVMENASTDELEIVMAFCSSVGLPIAFGQLGLGNITDKELMKVAELAVIEGETIHNMSCSVSADMVFANMKAADALGRDFLDRKIGSGKNIIKEC